MIEQNGTPGASRRVPGFRGLSSRLRRGLSRFVNRFRPLRAVAGLLDGWDERAARRLRESLGKRGRLVSWSREADGRWRARISGPGVVRTLERTGRTRHRAVTRSIDALDRLPALRALIGSRPGRRSSLT
jgi:hypothetical protein